MFEFDDIMLKPCLLQPCFHVAGAVGSLKERGHEKRQFGSKS